MAALAFSAASARAASEALRLRPMRKTRVSTPTACSTLLAEDSRASPHSSPLS